MRIVIADYSGHAFPVELSRELAHRGHEVLHLYFAEFQSPKGGLSRAPSDANSLIIESISLGKPFAKQDLMRRRGQEIEIGRRFAARVSAFQAEAVIGCNMPLDTIHRLQREAARNNRRFVFWQQDIYSVAIERILFRKFGIFGRLIGRYYRSIEGRVLRASDAVVVIARDFLGYLHRDFGVAKDRAFVVENWAPLDKISVQPQSNSWSRSQRIDGRRVVLYTGTLGMKHDPDLILTVAKSLNDRPDTIVLVTSEGPAADWLREQASACSLPRLQVLGFQPFELYPDVLASADVVLAILESDSGAFCIPSKILSYLCAGRAIAMSGPLDNLSARILAESGGGIAVPPGDGAGLAAAVKLFLDNPDRRELASKGGRSYAEANFSIAHKADQFEAILARLGLPRK